MGVIQRIIAGAASVGLIILIIDMLRRRRLREEYTIFWLISCLVILAIAIEDRLIYWFADLLQIDHPAYSLFVLAIFIGLVIALHFTTVISKMTSHIWKLTQELGLLREELETLRSECDHKSSSSQDA